MFSRSGSGSKMIFVYSRIWILMKLILIIPTDYKYYYFYLNCCYYRSDPQASLLRGHELHILIIKFPFRHQLITKTPCYCLLRRWLLPCMRNTSNYIKKCSIFLDILDSLSMYKPDVFPVIQKPTWSAAVRSRLSKRK